MVDMKFFASNGFNELKLLNGQLLIAIYKFRFFLIVSCMHYDIK